MGLEFGVKVGNMARDHGLCVCMVKPVCVSDKPLEEAILQVDKIWKLTNVVRVRLAPRSSHSQRQATFPDNVCSYSPPVTVCHVMKIRVLFVFLDFVFERLVHTNV